MKFNDVFVVDDDTVSHFIIKKHLLNNNIKVVPTFFENGMEAIEALKNKINANEKLPDLILLDINMPIMDGWQFLEEFKALKKNMDKEVVVYIISSSDDYYDKEKAKAYNKEITDYYVKPISAEEIKAIFLDKKASHF